MTESITTDWTKLGTERTNSMDVFSKIKLGTETINSIMLNSLANTNISLPNKDKAYISLNNYEQYSTNPFMSGDKGGLENIPIGVKNILVNDKDNAIVNLNTGEVGGAVVFKKFKTIDEEEFVKIYVSQLKDLFSLKTNAMKVLSYIMSILKPNRDVIEFDLDECKKYTRYSSATAIYGGLGILLESKIIARSNKYYKYFINPTYFFNGNRLLIVSGYRKKTKSDKDDNLINEQNENILPAKTEIGTIEMDFKADE